MALSPIVAALSSPSILAAIFIIIDDSAGLSAGTPGIIRRNNGYKALASSPVMPEASAILSNPSQKHKMPVRFSAIEKAALEETKTELTNSVQTPPSPKTSARYKAIRKAETKKAIQMMFSIRLPPHFRRF